MPASPSYLQLDVFCARPGGGNPLGVVIGAHAWSAGDMQRFAAWTDLVETTFVLAPTTSAASYRLRIFTPDREIPFAGHPTIGSAHAVLETGFAQAHEGSLIQECAAGLLPIRVEGDADARELFVQSPSAHVLPTDYAGRELLHAVLGDIAPGVLPPAFIEGGRRWWLAEFASEALLRTWQPDHRAIGALARATDSLGLCVFARAADRASAVNPDADYDLVVRAFPAGVGIVEDPASGAANGLIGAWIAQREPHGSFAHGYRVSQGREMGRDASIKVRIDKGAVWVGGRTHTVVSGITFWQSRA
ncbi:MAG: PhzF family phenazine biosynthesis protein [Dokdonella sp.]